MGMEMEKIRAEALACVAEAHYHHEQAHEHDGIDDQIDGHTDGQTSRQPNQPDTSPQSLQLSMAMLGTAPPPHGSDGSGDGNGEEDVRASNASGTSIDSERDVLNRQLDEALR